MGEILHAIATKAHRARAARDEDFRRTKLCRAVRWVINATRAVERQLRLKITTQEVSGGWAADVNVFFDLKECNSFAPVIGFKKFGAFWLVADIEFVNLSLRHPVSKMTV